MADTETGKPGVDPEAVVREYYDRVDREDVEGLLELFADDVRYDRPGQAAIEGIEALRAFYERDRPLEDGSHEVVHVLVDGRHVAVRGRFSGVQGGDRVAFGFADHHEFDADGLIANRWTYTDRDTV
ncbi:nuclear transport factor 2 family protein [Natrononativus amylolyticus]|uniref:nuclear transport factor 2 family protein n=1 Tax=Natrononativus amylolyticus TaxID=2963434 RepID=UPI0020CC27CB|nr:nuclear transport factor 2 family protein [Natrononativus amylolyticus]